jgi:hypothetical protein
MHDPVAFTPQEVTEAHETGKVPQRTDGPADDIQVDKSKAMLPNLALEHRIRGENVDLPSVGSCNFAQAKNDSASASKARVADNV